MIPPEMREELTLNHEAIARYRGSGYDLVEGPETRCPFGSPVRSAILSKGGREFVLTMQGQTPLGLWSRHLTQI